MSTWKKEPRSQNQRISRISDLEIVKKIASGKKTEHLKHRPKRWFCWNLNSFCCHYCFLWKEASTPLIILVLFLRITLTLNWKYAKRRKTVIGKKRKPTKKINEYFGLDFCSPATWSRSFRKLSLLLQTIMKPRHHGRKLIVSENEEKCGIKLFCQRTLCNIWGAHWFIQSS